MWVNQLNSVKPWCHCGISEIEEEIKNGLC